MIKNSPWRAILIAIILLVGGELLLAWQYNRLESGRIADIEEKIEEQQKTIEVQAARETLRDFLDARIAGDENRIGQYVTEQAMQQRSEGRFELFEVRSYEIVESNKLGDTNFRFQVKITRDRSNQVEFIDVTKILDQYYINSIELAG
jgi:hypothetical protein